jgi:iron(III) transport system permease protein
MFIILWTGIVSTFFGVLCAWFCTNVDFPFRKTISWMLVLPLASPAYVIAYVYADLFEYGGIIHLTLENYSNLQIYSWPKEGLRSIFGASLVFAFVLYPYIYLLCRTSFIQKSERLEEISQVLGSSKLKSFFRVSLPMSRPAIIGGLTLIIMEVVADFGVADYFGISTLTTGVFRTWLSLGDRISALQLSAGIFIIIFFIILLENFYRKGDNYNPDNVIKHKKLLNVKGLKYFVTIFCFIPIAIGFIIPIYKLITMHIISSNSLLEISFINNIINSFSVASIASTITLIIAIILIYADRINPSRIIKKLIEVSTLGYALPGAIIGLGVIVVLTWIDLNLSRLSIKYLDYNLGLILTGSITALILSYVIRFLTISFNTCHSSILKINPLIDEKAKILGAKHSRILSTIHFPLMFPAIISAWVLVFVEVIKELPATLILRPFNFETLSTNVYRLASDEKLIEASTSSLIMISLGIISVLILTSKYSLGIYSKQNIN